MKFLLALLTIYLILRYIIPSIFKMIFINIFKQAKKKSNNDNSSKSSNKKKTNEKYGEYIDYEDID